MRESLNWENDVKKISPCVVKIETPDHHGTGFFLQKTKDGETVIATARHVLEQADKWQQPIRVYDSTCSNFSLIRDCDRVVFLETLQGADSSFMIISRDVELKFPQQPLPFSPVISTIPIGASVGWVGFPGLAANNLCFFSGAISSRLPPGKFPCYLIDGVAIGGVSGGPIFYRDSKGLKVIGVISAYITGKTGDEAVPGLAVAEDIRTIQTTIDHLYEWTEQERLNNRLRVGEHYIDIAQPNNWECLWGNLKRAQKALNASPT